MTLVHKDRASFPSTIDVIAVTKTWPFTYVRAGYESGFRHFGENRVEEAKEKILCAGDEALGGISWHMIGHVQTRKVKDVVALFSWIDSVDSWTLLEKLNAEAAKTGKQLNILLEVNISGEPSKFGFPLHGWETDTKIFQIFLDGIKTMSQFPSLIPKGLMTMSPFTQKAETNRAYYQSMKKLSRSICKQVPNFGNTLSMGTSCDYRVALEEGATQIRVGETLFGKRPIG